MAIDGQVALQLLISVATAHLLEWLKCNPRFAWITSSTDLTNRVLAFGAAFITAAGISWTATGNWLEGGVITINMPPADRIVTGFINTALRMGSQILTQEGYYRFLIKPKSADPGKRND